VKLRDDPAQLRNAISVAASNLGLPPRQVEKDYWVTETMRALFGRHGEQLLFKGGTSLSKGWRIIERFSEDIDLLLLTEPGDKTNALLGELNAIAGEVCASEPTVELDVPGYAQRIAVPFPQAPNLQRARNMRKDILLEPGVRGGPLPHESVTISTFVADGLDAQSVADYEDLKTFAVQSLHPARTFVEKLFAVDGIAHAVLADPDRPVRGTESRHFYDLYFLADAASPALTYLQESKHYEEIARDCEAVSHRWFPTHATKRPEQGFRTSAAFVDPTVADRIGSSFDQVMDDLCYPGAFRPTFADVTERLRSIEWL
jgi:predicted nucleotidyltransferase component of viral defense system